MKKIGLIVSMLISFFYGNVFAQEAHTKNSASELAISVIFDQQGQLWRASVQNGFVLVAKSIDQGNTFSQAVKVNTKPQKVAARGEGRPKIAIGSQGNIYLTWTQALSKPFTGYVWFSRSTDHGVTFDKPQIVHQDRAEITHRFDALAVSANGTITVAWVDKRDLVAAKKVGQPYAGGAIYYAVSNDDGSSFQVEKKLADNSCECCRIALTHKADGTAVALWRHVFAGSERDHAIAEIHKDKTSKIVRASYGRWKLDGCPHHGAAITEGKGFGYHMAYFDGAGDHPSLMLSRMDGEAWVSSPPKRFGNMNNNAGHPTLMSIGEQVWVAWREKTAEKGTEIYSMHSTDGGRSWSNAHLVFKDKNKTDYPFLIKTKGLVYLTINTIKNGLQVIPLMN